MKAYQAARDRLRTGDATRGDMDTVRDYEEAHRKDLKPRRDGGKVAATKPKPK